MLLYIFKNEETKGLPAGGQNKVRCEGQILKISGKIFLYNE